MKFYIAAFKSRRDALSFAATASRLGVPVKVVGTPLSIGSGCGLSVKFPIAAAARAQRALQMGEYASFLGFFQG